VLRNIFDNIDSIHLHCRKEIDVFISDKIDLKVRKGLMRTISLIIVRVHIHNFMRSSFRV